MTGSPIKRERKARWLALKADPAFAADCISRIACGDSIRALAAENDIPINTFWHWITKEHGGAVAAARKVVAAQLADQMKEAAERVEAGELNPKAAQTASSIRQWLAARYDRETFGDKSSVDVTHKGIVGLHLEAIRQLANEPIDGEWANVNDEMPAGGGLERSEYGKVDEEDDDEDGHPLDCHPLL